MKNAMFCFLIVFFASCVPTTPKNLVKEGMKAIAEAQAEASAGLVVQGTPKALVEEDGLMYITGMVKNTTDREYTYAQIAIALYDKDNAQIGTSMSNVANLKPGIVWKFKAIVLEKGVVKAEVSSLTGF